jgi:hypothetical protein
VTHIGSLTARRKRMQINLDLKKVARKVGRGIGAVFNLNRWMKAAVIIFCGLGIYLMVDTIAIPLPPPPQPVIQVTPECGFTYPPKVVETFLTIAPKINTCWNMREEGAVWRWQLEDMAVIGVCVFPQDEEEL